jgi:hypothetical protein
MHQQRSESRLAKWLSTSYNPEPRTRHESQIPLEMQHRLR